MNRYIILLGKLNLCYDVLLFKEYIAMAIDSTQSIKELFSNVHKINMLNNINFNRIDILFYNKLFELVKFFNELGIHPIFSLDDDNNIICSLYFNRFVLQYLTCFIGSVVEYQTKIISSLKELMVRCSNLSTKNKLKLLFFSSEKKREILNNDEIIKETTSSLYELYNTYESLLSICYDFNLKDYFLEVVEYYLNDQLDKLSSDEIKCMPYDFRLNAEFMKYLGIEDKIGELRNLYLKYLSNYLDESDFVIGNNSYFFDKSEIDEWNISDIIHLSETEIVKMINDIKKEVASLESGGIIKKIT